MRNTIVDSFKLCDQNASLFMNNIKRLDLTICRVKRNLRLYEITGRRRDFE